MQVFDGLNVGDVCGSSKVLITDRSHNASRSHWPLNDHSCDFSFVNNDLHIDLECHGL